MFFGHGYLYHRRYGWVAMSVYVITLPEPTNLRLKEASAVNMPWEFLSRQKCCSKFRKKGGPNTGKIFKDKTYNKIDSERRALVLGAQKVVRLWT